MRILTITLVSVFKCSPAVSPQGQVNATQTDIGVVFSNMIPTAELPPNRTVTQTLVDAANSNETFSVILKASSIQLICK